MKIVNAPHELDEYFDVPPGDTQIRVPGSDLAQRPIDVEFAPVGEDSSDDHDTDIVVVSAEDEEGISPVDLYDRKDDDITTQLDDVTTKALEAYETMIVTSQTVIDKKHAPRNAEVAASFLQIALNAIKEKDSVKGRKDRIAHDKSKHRRKQDGGAPARTITNNIVADRETALKLLKEQRSGES